MSFQNTRRPEFNLGWIIGFLEGEGSFLVSYTSKNRHMYIVKATSTDLDMLERLKEFAGAGKIYGPYISKKNGLSSPKWRDVYTWKIQKREQVEQFILDIKPFLLTKRSEQTQMILDHMDKNPKRKPPGRPKGNK